MEVNSLVFAVPTQVLVAKNLNNKGVMSIATKVAIQMNCKVGGAPWSVSMPLGVSRACRCVPPA